LPGSGSQQVVHSHMHNASEVTTVWRYRNLTVKFEDDFVHTQHHPKLLIFLSTLQVLRVRQTSTSAFLILVNMVEHAWIERMDLFATVRLDSTVPVYTYRDT